MLRFNTKKIFLKKIFCLYDYKRIALTVQLCPYFALIGIFLLQKFDFALPSPPPPPPHPAIRFGKVVACINKIRNKLYSHETNCNKKKIWEKLGFFNGNLFEI